MGAGSAVFALLVIVFVAASARLSRAYVTAPMAFLTMGALFGLTAFGTDADESSILLLAEVTLVLLLFHDAAQVQPRQLRADSALDLRLLLIGLPLTVLAGWALARLLFPDIGVWPALLIGAALAPTDAGLGAATVLNPVVPVRIRRILNVESGLNDGLVTPVVFFAIAAIAGAEELAPRVSLTEALEEIALGLTIGVVAGVAGARLLGRSRARGWAEVDLIPVAVLVLPLLGYATAGVVGGNGFIAAFTSGTAFAAAARWLPDEPSAMNLTEAGAGLLGFAVWALAGAVAVVAVGDSLDWRTVAYAVASLTVLRMVPVWLALLGSGLRLQSVAFIGWFGPRGLASLVFVLIAAEELVDDATLARVVDVIAVTVILSVLAHGLSADPLARRFGAWASRVQPPVEMGLAVEPRGRRVAPRMAQRDRDGAPDAA
jgi:NhaP-type Na+/H+ or K+/H+ antiporter